MTGVSIFTKTNTIISVTDSILHNISSQCYLSAQIEQVEDKWVYSCILEMKSQMNQYL